MEQKLKRCLELGNFSFVLKFCYRYVHKSLQSADKISGEF